MQYFSIPQYILISLIAYILRFTTDKLFLFYKPIKEFRYTRMILPSVKVWDSSRSKLFYDEMFSLVETFIITLLYIMTYWTIPAVGFGRGFIFIFAVFIVSLVAKSRFTLIQTNYPVSLFVFDILRMALAYIVQSIALVLMYKPISF